VTAGRMINCIRTLSMPERRTANIIASSKAPLLRLRPIARPQP